MTIEEIEERNLLAYKHLRGSWSHGIGVEGKSDYDYCGVYFQPFDNMLGLSCFNEEQSSDAKSDIVYYEFGRWFDLLIKSNPTALESLFVDEEFIVGKVHPVIQKVIDNRDLFLSQDCFNPILGYAFEQIKKARGLNKKIVNPIKERKGVLDFCSVAYEQGSKKVVDWLNDYGMKQKYCGLVALPNMHDTYGLYYDWTEHFIEEFNIDIHSLDSINEMGSKIIEYTNKETYEEYAPLRNGMDKFLNAFDHLRGAWYYFQEQLYNSKPFFYSGIVNEDGTSNDIHLSSIPKNEKPIAIMSFNKTGYQSHCKDYREYKEWEKNRNPIRYESNLDKNYDAKNMCECIRLIHMGIELARDGKFNVKRTWDRDFLLNIKNHGMEYEEIMEYVENKYKEFQEAVKTCKLPEHIDIEKVNNLLIACRMQYYNL